MAKKPASVSDVFWIYNQGGAVVDNDSIWMRFDREFVRLMNAENISWKELAGKLSVSWHVLNSGSRRGSDPKWMTPIVLRTMLGLGFDVDYVLFGQASKPVLKPDEAALLDNYRNSTPDNQAVLRKVGAALEKQIDDDGEVCA